MKLVEASMWVCALGHSINQGRSDVEATYSEMIHLGGGETRPSDSPRGSPPHWPN
jgi:hypothetical protein